jgi:hypothetical protein
MMNLSTKNILILATIAVGIFVAGIVFTLTIGFVLAAALPEEPEKSTLPQPAQGISSPMVPNTGPSPNPENSIIYPENRIIPSPLPNLPPEPPVRVAPVPRNELPFQKIRESIEPGEPRRTRGGGLRYDGKAPNELNPGTALAQAPTNTGAMKRSLL